MARAHVIEDELLIALMLEEWLQDQGHDVILATGNGDAPSSMDQSIDFAIVDYGMGGEDASSSIEELRRRRVPLILLTATEIAEGNGLSDISIYMKPVKFDQLAIGVARLLEQPSGPAIGLRSANCPALEESTI
jgi:DNA-binding response OmpR family regulator